MVDMVTSTVVILCLCGCASSQTDGDDQLLTSGAAAAAAWRFDFVDTEDKSLGYLVMAFTDQQVDEPSCGYDYWKKMVVLDDKLDFDFGAEFQPAYTIFGPWLTIDTQAERFTNSAPANEMLTREYRTPFVVPEEV